MKHQASRSTFSLAADREVKIQVFKLANRLQRTPSWVGNQLLRKALGLDFHASVAGEAERASVKQER